MIARCNACGAVYERIDALWTHYKARHGRKACRWCGKPYLYESGRIRHEAKEHPPAPLDETRQAERRAMA